MKKYLNYLRWQKQRFFSPPKLSSFMEIERAERIFYLNYLREGMTVFDVGANIGELTLLFSHFVGSGNVHAFEASEATYKRLETICNAAGKPNIIKNHLALSDKKGFIELHIYEDAFSVFNSQSNRPLKDYGLDIESIGVEKVSAATIDNYCESEEIEQIDLLKIDVEGAEFQVMQGAFEMLKNKRISCLTFEFGQTTFEMGTKPEEIEIFFKDLDYKIQNIVEGEAIFPGRESIKTAQYAMHIATPN